MLSHVVAFIALLAILNSGAGFIWDWTIKNSRARSAPASSSART
jgi:hypothetical protein